MSVSKFKVVGLLDMASRPSQGTITIDRGSGLFTVRPLRRRRTYTLPLYAVAEMVVRRMIAREVMEKKAAKKVAKKSRRVR